MTRFPALAFFVVVLLAPGLASADEFESALSELVKDLTSEDPTRVQAAVAPLIALPQTQAERVRVRKALSPVLADEPGDEIEWASEARERTQEALVDVLAGLGAEGEPGLLQALSLLNSEVQERAGAHLAARGPRVLPKVFAELRRVGWKKMICATTILIRLGPQIFQDLITALEDPSADVRFVAVWTLIEFDERAEPHLVRVLEGDAEGEVRLAAAQGLLSVSYWDKVEVHPAALSALEDDPDPKVRRGIAKYIGGLGRLAKPILPLLLACYREANSEEEAKVYAQSITRIGTDLRRDEGLRWWTFLQAYPGPTFLLFLFLLCWYPFAPRVKRLGLTKQAVIAKTLIVALVPAGLVGGWVLFALTRPWAPVFFRPRDFPLTAEVAASGFALAAGLAGWVAARWKLQAPEPEEVPQADA